jgi:ABC-2 type transport system permease protein
VEFNVLAYLAPGMALMFLMFTVSNGGRTLLAERNLGTLPRLLVAPVNTMQVLCGKVFGIFITGAAQMFILIGASTLLFGLRWGDPMAVILLVLAAVTGAVGWGLLITALARSPGQVATVGSAVMLIFGILGGSFTDLSNMGPAIQAASKITPNAWALTGFAILAGGGSLLEIVQPIAALLVMGGVLFLAATLIIQRRALVQG